MRLTEYIKGQLAGGVVTEAVNLRDFQKACALIRSYLGKRGIYTIPVSKTLMIGSRQKTAIAVFTTNGTGAVFLWDMQSNMGSSEVDSVYFTDDMDEFLSYWYEDTHVDLNMKCGVILNGASITKAVRLVEDVLTGKVRMSYRALVDFVSGARMYEGYAVMEDALADIKKKKAALYMRIRSWNRKGKDTTELQKQYDDVVSQYNVLKTSAVDRPKVSILPDVEVSKAQAFFEDDMRATPEERFDDMKSYIYNVITGIRPLALICGAPGVGKTFRVMQAVEGTKKQLGRDYLILKGRCTPTALFIAAFEMRKENQLLIIDDCDSIFKDNDSINLIKAMYDSSDRRIVTWAVSRPPEVDAEKGELLGIIPNEKGKYFLPRDFEYKGGGIIITNLRAGMIDTAIRNRALICDLDFTTDEIIGLIRGIAPKIKPNEISAEAKERAIAYLEDLVKKGAPVELSIRTFTLCAGMYMSDAPEKAIQRRINEQMRLQSARGGRRY